MRALLLVVMLVWVILPCSAATIAEEYQAASAMVAQGKLADAVPALSRILALAAEKGWDKLDTSELMQVAGAHSLLMARLYGMALEKPDITAEQKAEATRLSEVALGQEDIRVVAHGEEVDLEKLLIPGKTNIVDFFSLYCGPCISFGAYVDKLTELREDIVLIKVDINRPGHKGIDWGSPTAQQFGLQSIPHLRVYGPDGKLQAEGQEARAWVTEQIQSAGL